MSEADDFEKAMKVIGFELEMEEVKNDLKDMIEKSEGKDKEMYQEILDFAENLPRP